MTTSTTTSARAPRARGRAWRTILTSLLLLSAANVVACAAGKPAHKAEGSAVEWHDVTVGATNGSERPRTVVANGHLTMRGGGENLASKPTAELHFRYVSFDGDFEFVTRVVDKDELGREESRAGIMMRPSLEPNVPFTFLYFAGKHVEGLRCNASGQTRFAYSHVENKKPPIWLRITRWHRTVTAYYSEDGREWTPMPIESPIDLPENLMVGLAVSHGAPSGETTAEFDQVYAGPLRLPYKTSWLGNSFGGNTRWVQDHIAAMYVGPDGTCYTQAEWDEGQGNCSMYRDGDKIGALENTGWGQAGTAIAGDGKIIYLGALKPGTKTPALRRFHLDGTHASFPGGFGDGSYLLVPDKVTITALACGEGRLYLADRPGNRIYVLNPVTGAVIRDWACTEPHFLAVDTYGNVWVNQRVPGHATVRCYTSDGQDTGRKIDDLTDPGGMGIDNHGRLLIADCGPDQQIRKYAELNSTPKLVETVGPKGGIYSGVPGAIEPNKLPTNIVSLGTDRAGNMYVGADGWAWSGVDIRKYSPAGELKWRLLGLEGVVEFGDFDAKTQADAYSRQEHFAMDLSNPQGTEWSYKGFTLDPFAFPDDPRLHINGQTTLVRYLKDREGKPRRFLININNWGSCVQIYRFDPDRHGEIAIPCMMMADGVIRDTTNVIWPASQPQKTPWIWRDSKGDGRVRPEDITAHPTDGRGWDIDSNGDLWQVGNAIYHSKYLGLDTHGVPEYAPPEKLPIPAPFTDLHRIQYFPQTETLYLSGHTAEHPNKPYNGFPYLGTEIARYDHWHRGSSSEPTWRLAVPRSTTNAQQVTEAMDVAGEYLFAVENFSARMHVYDVHTAKEVAILVPGPEVGGISGWVDIPYGLFAYRRADGEYLIFAEEDYHNKILLYRWVPQGSSTQAARR
jgi:hypothetical protein